MGAVCSKFIKQDRNAEENNETVCEYSPFLRLPYVVKHEILSNLETNNLLVWRLVSKDTKIIADSILMLRRERHSFNRYIDKKSKIVAVMKVFNRADLLYLLDRPKKRRFAGFRSEVGFVDLLKLCKQSLSNVTYIYVKDKNCGPRNCRYIIECFPKLEYLSLYDLRLDDKSVAYILRSLPALKGLHFENLPISGACFANVGKNVHIIQMENMRVTMANSLPEATNIDNFTVHIKENMNADNVLTVTTKMPKLQHLFLSCQELYSLESLKSIASPHFSSLEVNATAINGLNTTIKFENVTKLKTHVCDTFNLFELLLKFPNLKELRINFKYCLDLTTTEIAMAVNSLRALETLTLNGSFFSRKRLVCDVNGVVTNGLVNLIRSADFVKSVNLNIQFVIAMNGDRKYFEETIKSVQMLRKEYMQEKNIIVQYTEL